ncbi:methyl-accepting chemotaxis protein [Bacillus sp. CECT 9360]|uniref:methyl-accepting chemotaxis protein n=1 Tax=Bacillus sp. CECT 9360 TaxID=2845821 RepID=UPI001E4C596C|nr:methyl-accepting chemotaxis protein [Bacillus sp. CECT 9360]CAH0346424.1 hypothetical protein BCI9360_02758 [Bacillus sp. CECT 9360]
MQKQKTLRKKFLTWILITLFFIAFISGGIQLYFMNQQVDYEIRTQSSIIANSIEQGIQETDLASNAIEQQIDLKMIGYAKSIGDLLQNKETKDITTQELVEIKEKLNLSGLTVFKSTGNDIVAVKATDPKEIGFSAKNFGDVVYQASDAMLKGKEPNMPGAYTEKGMLVLPIMQSGMHKDKPVFFKYAYYHVEGTDYIVNPYIEADEVYQFTQKVGPDSWVKKMEEENHFIKEIAVLDPMVFKNPEMEKQFWPPMKKVVYGDYQYKSKKDVQSLKSMAEKPKKASYVQEVKGEKVLKIFLPIDNKKVIFMALDYKAMTDPLYRHSIVLIISGLVSLIVLFLLTARFFNKIYENIQKIRNQIKSMEAGDLTSKSDVNDQTELGNLSESTNRMADGLNTLVKETQEQATRIQKLALLLEAESSQSVEKMYELSTEATMKSRDQLYEITQFLDRLADVLKTNNQNEDDQKLINEIEVMRDLANERTVSTTNITITLSDLLQSLHLQSSELSNISNILLDSMGKFKL